MARKSIPGQLARLEKRVSELEERVYHSHAERLENMETMLRVGSRHHARDYVPLSVAAGRLGVHPETIKRWRRNESIKKVGERDVWQLPNGRWVMSKRRLNALSQPPAPWDD